MTNTETLRALVDAGNRLDSAMDMQEQRERGTFHLSQQAAAGVWKDARRLWVEAVEQALSAGDGVAEGLTVPSGWRINHSHDGGLVVSGPIGGCVVFAGKGRIADRVLHAIANDLLAAAPAAPVAEPVKLAPMCHAVIRDDDVVAAYYHASQRKDAEQFAKERGWECESLFAGSAIDYIVGQRVKAAAPVAPEHSHGGRPMTLREIMEAEEGVAPAVEVDKAMVERASKAMARVRVPLVDDDGDEVSVLDALAHAFGDDDVGRANEVVWVMAEDALTAALGREGG